jgi:DNA gyrase/topoisomerase IV, subunit A
MRMGQRSGVGLVELAILETLDARRAWPGRRASPCLKVLAALEDELGLVRGYAYQVLIDMALPWKIPIPLIEGQGNFGGRGNDPPASPYYTEARMSPAGQIALASERSQIAPVPLGLINGNTHRQGTRPPFRPAAVIDTIWQVLARPRLPARQITTLMGLPDFITGCAVTGDLAALAAGQRTELGLHARVTVTDAAYVRARVAKAAVPGYTPPRYTQDASRPVIIVDKLRRTPTPTTLWPASPTAPADTRGTPAIPNSGCLQACRLQTSRTSPPGAITGSRARPPTAPRRRCYATSS